MFVKHSWRVPEILRGTFGIRSPEQQVGILEESLFYILNSKIWEIQIV